MLLYNFTLICLFYVVLYAPALPSQEVRDPYEEKRSEIYNSTDQSQTLERLDMRRPPPPPPPHHSPSPHHPPPPPQSPPYWDPPPPFMDEYYPLNYESQYHHTPPYETGRSYDTSHKMEGYKAALYDGDTRNHHPPPPPSYKSRDSYVPHRYERDEYHYPPPPPPLSRSDHPQPPHLREEYHNSPPPHPPFTRDGFPPPLPPDRRNGYQHPPPPPPPHERDRYHHHPPPPPPPPPPNEGGRNLHYPPPPPPPLPPPPHERDRYDYPPPPPPPLEMYEFSMQSAVLNGDEYYHRSSSQQQHTSIDSSYQRPTHKPEENLDKSSSSQDKHIYSVSSTAAPNDLAIKSSLTKGTNIELNGEYNENIFKPLGKKVTVDYIIEDRSVPTSTKRRETESKKENDYSALIDVRFADDEDSPNMKEVTNNSTYSYRIYMETFSPYLFQATPVIPES